MQCCIHPSNLVTVILLVYTTYEDGIDSVLQRRHIKFRHRGINQKKEYNIHNQAKVRNPE